MQEIIKNKTVEGVSHYKEKGILKGLNLTLLSLMLNSFNKIIKIEGVREEYGREVFFHDIISIKEGKLDYYIAYGKENIGEYKKIDADLLMKSNVLSVGLVVRCFIEQRGWV